MITICSGTGRSGTLSIAHLLSSCKDVLVTHEIEPHLPWEGDKWKDYYRERLRKWRETEQKWIGDSASYYLPYLDPIPEDVKVIFMERAKEEVIESFDKISGRLNNWQTFGPHNSVWAPCFPNFDQVKDKREALGLYWDFYMEKTGEVCSKFPENTLRFPLEELNSKEGQERIFDFFEIPVDNRNFTIPCNFHARPIEMIDREPVNVEGEVDIQYEEEESLLSHYNSGNWHSFRKFYEVKDFLDTANINLNKEKKILDLGCGDGALGFLINRYWDLPVDGVDYSEKRLAYAMNNDGDYFLDDIHNFVENSNHQYDIIFLTETLEHLKEPVKVVENTKGMLRKNGKIIATVPKNMKYKAHLQVFESEEDLQKFNPDQVIDYNDRWIMRWENGTFQTS